MADTPAPNVIVDRRAGGIATIRLGRPQKLNALDGGTLRELLAALAELAMGLVTRVVPPEKLAAEAQELAEALAAKAPLALRQAKRATAVAADADLPTGCGYEIEAFAVTFASEDRVEGLRAFLEKRQPAWKGR
jgi:enoyl-CoA hydratase